MPTQSGDDRAPIRVRRVVLPEDGFSFYSVKSSKTSHHHHHHHHHHQKTSGSPRRLEEIQQRLDERRRAAEQRRKRSTEVRAKRSLGLLNSKAVQDGDYKVLAPGPDVKLEDLKGHLPENAPAPIRLRILLLMAANYLPESSQSDPHMLALLRAIARNEINLSYHDLSSSTAASHDNQHLLKKNPQNEQLMREDEALQLRQEEMRHEIQAWEQLLQDLKRRHANVTDMGQIKLARGVEVEEQAMWIMLDERDRELLKDPEPLPDFDLLEAQLEKSTPALREHIRLVDQLDFAIGELYRNFLSRNHIANTVSMKPNEIIEKLSGMELVA